MKIKGLLALITGLILIFFSLFKIYKPNDFELEFVNHKPIYWSELKNHWVIIHYWATWCAPCIEELPKWNKFYTKNKNNLLILGFNAEGLDDNEQQKLLQEYNIKFLSLKNDILSQLKIPPVNAIPATIIINPQGRLKKIIYGPKALSYIKSLPKLKPST